ncbi:hypothetical protein [Flavobacterium sp.]|uniref:hypothetical protein n=1 Tax=Flavobacterium sp. TaxID=239 RepID=UPI003752A368
MVVYLEGKGVQSYNYFKSNFNKKNEEAIRAKIKKDGFDGAVKMRLIDVDKEKIYTPGEFFFIHSITETLVAIITIDGITVQRFAIT